MDGCDKSLDTCPGTSGGFIGCVRVRGNEVGFASWRHTQSNPKHAPATQLTHRPKFRYPLIHPPPSNDPVSNFMVRSRRGFAARHCWGSAAQTARTGKQRPGPRVAPHCRIAACTPGWLRRCCLHGRHNGAVCTLRPLDEVMSNKR